jgi:hypothetical protein
LQCNDIGDINDLRWLENLQILHLADNWIQDIEPLTALTHLRGLNLTANPLNTEAYCLDLPQIREKNPDIDLQYDPNPYPECRE